MGEFEELSRLVEAARLHGSRWYDARELREDPEIKRRHADLIAAASPDVLADLIERAQRSE